MRAHELSQLVDVATVPALVVVWLAWAVWRHNTAFMGNM